MDFKIDAKGIKELNKALSELEPKVARKVLRTTLRDGMKEIASEAKANCPVETGALRSDIKVRAGKRKKNKISFNCFYDKSKSINSKGKFYAPPVEFGRKTATGKVEGQHFMRKAWESKGEQVGNKMTEEIKKTIEETK